jgi:hypothetical protein
MRINYFFSLMAFMLLLPNLVYGQWKYEDDVRVPPNVKGVFQTKYPAARQLSWTWDEGKYMANFLSGDYFSDASFDEAGNWIETLTTIDELALPKCILDDVRQRFADFAYFDLIIRRDCPQKTTFEVQFYHKEADLSLLYSPGGMLIGEKEN